MEEGSYKIDTKMITQENVNCRLLSLSLSLGYNASPSEIQTKRHDGER